MVSFFHIWTCFANLWCCCFLKTPIRNRQNGLKGWISRLDCFSRNMLDQPTKWDLRGLKWFKDRCSENMTTHTGYNTPSKWIVIQSSSCIFFQPHGVSNRPIMDKRIEFRHIFIQFIKSILLRESPIQLYMRHRVKYQIAYSLTCGSMYISDALRHHPNERRNCLTWTQKLQWTTRKPPAPAAWLVEGCNSSVERFRIRGNQLQLVVYPFILHFFKKGLIHPRWCRISSKIFLTVLLVGNDVKHVICSKTLPACQPILRGFGNWIGIDFYRSMCASEMFSRNHSRDRMPVRWGFCESKLRSAFPDRHSIFQSVDLYLSWTCPICTSIYGGRTLTLRESHAFQRDVGHSKT